MVDWNGWKKSRFLSSRNDLLSPAWYFSRKRWVFSHRAIFRSPDGTQNTLFFARFRGPFAGSHDGRLKKPRDFISRIHEDTTKG